MWALTSLQAIPVDASYTSNLCTMRNPGDIIYSTDVQVLPEDAVPKYSRSTGSFPRTIGTNGTGGRNPPNIQGNTSGEVDKVERAVDTTCFPDRLLA